MSFLPSENLNRLGICNDSISAAQEVATHIQSTIAPVVETMMPVVNAAVASPKLQAAIEAQRSFMKQMKSALPIATGNPSDLSKIIKKDVPSCPLS